jgi:hypothetical protein
VRPTRDKRSARYSAQEFDDVKIGYDTEEDQGGSMTVQFCYGNPSPGNPSRDRQGAIPWNVVETRNGSNQATAQYFWGTQYTDELVMVDVNGDATESNDCDPDDQAGESTADERYFYHHGRNWNVVALSEYDTGGSNNGRIVERYSYTPYGQFVVLTGDSGSGELGNLLPTSTVGNVFTFQGLPYDGESGTDSNPRGARPMGGLVRTPVMRQMWPPPVPVPPVPGPAPSPVPKALGCQTLISMAFIPYEWKWIKAQVYPCYYGWRHADFSITGWDFHDLKFMGCLGYTPSNIEAGINNKINENWPPEEIYSETECPEGCCCGEGTREDGWNHHEITCTICFGWFGEVLACNDPEARCMVTLEGTLNVYFHLWYALCDAPCEDR